MGRKLRRRDALQRKGWKLIFVYLLGRIADLTEFFMFLARIISKGKIQDVPFYIEVTPKYTESDVPTLVVGKKRAVELFGEENVHVLDRDITETVSWTYAKNERRVDFEEDVKKFIDNVNQKLIRNVSYYFVNIFTEKLSFIKKLIRWIYSEKPKSVYVTDNHIYIYGGKNVIGISRGDLDYAGIDSDKVIKKISSNPENDVFFDNDFLDENVRKSVRGNNIMIPYIRFITH